MTTANANGTVATQTAAPAQELPLFFKRPLPLDSLRHKDAGVLPVSGYEFAREVNSVPVNTVEFVEAARHYPLVFTQTPVPFPAVIVGLEKQNYFIDSNAQWHKDSYIPAYVRKYPFIFMEVPQRNDLVLCVDEGAGAFQARATKKALPLYEGDAPSPVTRNALEFCTAFQQYHQFTRQFCAALQKADLFIPSRSDATLANGRKIELTGFQVIDEKKFQALPDETILQFHKQNWLPWVYFALSSASNWKKLVDMAMAQEQVPTANQN